MPTKTVKKTTARGKGKGLTKKVGPFPLYVYLAVVGILVIYFYYRHRQSQSSSATSQFAGSLNQQTIPSGVVVPSSTSNGSNNQGSNDGSVNYPTDYATQTDLQNAVDSLSNNTAAAIAGITFPTPNINLTVPTTGSSSPAATTSASKTAAKAAPSAQPFGGVIKTVKTKTGAVLTYYGSGRITEQAPGKTAYVVHK